MNDKKDDSNEGCIIGVGLIICILIIAICLIIWFFEAGGGWFLLAIAVFCIIGYLGSKSRGFR